MRRTSFSLGQHFEKFLKKQIKEGRYRTAGEVIRAGLLLLEEHEQEMSRLRAIGRGNRNESG